MNYTDFNITGGFPLNQARLSFLQNAYQDALVGLGLFIGGTTGLVVVSGCVNTSGVVADGVILYGGEVLPFEGGTLGTHIEIAETSEPLAGLVYFDAANNVSSTHYPQRVRFTRFSPVGTIPWQPIQLPDSAAAILQNVMTINQPWVQTNIALAGMYGVNSGSGILRYKIIGKTVHVMFRGYSLQLSGNQYFGIRTPLAISPNSIAVGTATLSVGVNLHTFPMYVDLVNGVFYGFHIDLNYLPSLSTSSLINEMVFNMTYELP